MVHLDGPSRLLDKGGSPTSFPGNESEMAAITGSVVVLSAVAWWRAARRRTER